MSFSARSKTAWGSFWLGAAIDVFAVIITAILNLLFHIQLTGLPLLIAVLAGVAIYIAGIKIFHPLWFWFGLLAGFIVIVIIIALIAMLIGVAILEMFFGTQSTSMLGVLLA